MAKKILLHGCPCCGEKAHWTPGDKNTRQPDRVQCLDCFLEIEGTYEPMSAVHKWNFRVLNHLTKDSYYNILGEKIE